MIKAAEIFRGIVRRIIVHVDEAGQARAMIVVVDHRIVSKIQFVRDRRKQRLDGAHVVRLLDFRKKCRRSEEHTSELQSLMRISYAVFCLKKNNITPYNNTNT